MPPLRPNFSGAATLRDDPLAALGSTIGNFSQQLANSEIRRNQQAQADNVLQRQRATDQGIAAALNPQAFAAPQIAAEQQGIAQSLANLNPADRAVAQQQLAANYNPAQRPGEIANAARLNPNADQGGILTALSRQANTARANLQTAQATPGTPEARAVSDARQTELNQTNARQRGLINFRQQVSDQADQREADSISSVLRANGVRVPPGTPLATVNELNTNFRDTRRRQVRAQEVANAADARRSSERRRLDEQRIGTTPERLEQFAANVASGIPLETRTFGRNDSGLLQSFFQEPEIIEALRRAGLTSKQLTARINTNLSSNGDLEETLETLAESLTNGSLNDIGSGIL